MGKRIRKAIVAAVTAGAGAAVSYQLGVGWNFTAEHIGATLGAFATAAIAAGVATWRVPNAAPGVQASSYR